MRSGVAPWEARRGHAAVAIQGRLVVLGGQGVGRLLNDVAAERKRHIIVHHLMVR